MAHGAMVLPTLAKTMGTSALRTYVMPPAGPNCVCGTTGTLHVPRSLGYARSRAALGNASVMRMRYSASGSTGAGAGAPLPLRPPPIES
eukprot:2914504-Amphidinium_carterae.1